MGSSEKKLIYKDAYMAKGSKEYEGIFVIFLQT